MNVGMNQRRRRSIETDLSISNGVPLLTSSTGLNSCASLIYVCVCVMARDRQVKHFVVELCCGWVAQKHGVGLDSRYKLPKMRNKGTIAKQRIRRKGADLAKKRKTATAASAGGGAGARNGEDAAPDDSGTERQRVLVEEVGATSMSGGSAGEEDAPSFALRAKARKAPATHVKAEEVVQHAAAPSSPARASVASSTATTSAQSDAVSASKGQQQQQHTPCETSDSATGEVPAVAAGAAAGGGNHRASVRKRGPQVPAMRHRVTFPERPATKAVVNVTLGLRSNATPPIVRVETAANVMRVSYTQDSRTSSGGRVIEVPLPMCVDADAAEASVCRGVATEEDLVYLRQHQEHDLEGRNAPESASADVGMPVWLLRVDVPFMPHTEYLKVMAQHEPHTPDELRFRSTAAAVI